jgi:hypothetical protein
MNEAIIDSKRAYRQRQLEISLARKPQNPV